MQNRKMKNIISLVLALVMCLGFVSLCPSAAIAATDYYASITATDGTELLGQLHDLITTTHTNYTSYADCKNPSYITKTDAGSNGNVMEFYSQADIASTWGYGDNGTWNREHVWCQSLSNGLWGESGGGADLHHIRPVETSLNSARGNNKFGEITGGSAVYYKDADKQYVAIGGYVKSNVFEPIDSVKGDVARILFYVYVHYNTYSNVGGTTNGSGSSSYFGTLSFANIVSASSESAAIEMLLAWNAEDPVDSTERARNEAVYQIQGNRNPFVDNADYAEDIWGDGSGSDTPDDPDPTPSSDYTAANMSDLSETTPYKLVVEQQTVGATLYIKNEVANSYYMASTETASESDDVYVQKTSDGFYLYFSDGGTKSYLNVSVSGTYVNLVSQSSASTVWQYDSSNSCIKTAVTVGGSETYAYIGAYNSYTTFSTSLIKYLDGDSSYAAYLAVESSAEPDPDPDPDPDVDYVELSNSSISLQVGETFALEASGSGAVAWSTSDATVAVVSSEGVVTAVSAGKTTVFATCGKASAPCVVTVTESSDPSPDPNPDDQQTVVDTSAFSAAIEQIDEAQTFSAKFRALQTAIAEYNDLDDAGKEAASQGYAELLQAIAEYNDEVSARNAEMNSAFNSD